MAERKPFVGGNWKMNTDRAGATALAREVQVGSGHLGEAVDVAIYPPFVYLDAVGGVLEGGCPLLGAQDAYHEPDGAFTGEISLSMLSDLGVGSVLVGHSERRHVLGETDDLISRKARTVIDAGMQCVLCIGETQDQRDAGETDHINRMQLTTALNEIDQSKLCDLLVVAYEPVWAIGTGKTATPDDAQAAQHAIRTEISKICGEDNGRGIRIIYGGSVKPGNAAQLFEQPDIDGFLVGGASLKADDFLAIVEAAASSRVG